MNKLITSFIVMLFFSSQFIFGQQNNSKTEEAFLQQIESCAPSIDQTLTRTSVPGNIAELIQNGNINNAVITQN